MSLIVAKVFLLFLVAWILLLTQRRASAANRHFILGLAFLGSLLLPALSLITPGWEVIPSFSVGSGGEDVSDPGRLTEEGASARRASDAGKLIAGQTQQEVADAGRSSAVLQPAPDWALMLGTVWALGAACLATVLVVRAVAMSLEVRRSHPVQDPQWTGLMEETRRRLGLCPSVLLLRRGEGRMPALWGLRRPVVLLPAECDTWAPERRRAVLAHELSHVVRRDIWVLMVGQIACALHWFNPLVWTLQRRLAVERETACDDRVLDQGIRPAHYADQLLNMALAYGREGGLAPVMAARSQLEGRIMSILDTHRSRKGVSRVAAATMALLLLAGMIPLASFAWAERGKEPRRETVSFGHSDTAVFKKRLAGEFRTPPTLEQLIDGLKSSSAEMRGACAWALGHSGDEQVIEPLLSVVDDEDAIVRQWAIRSLGRFRDDRIPYPLIDRLNDPDTEVREWAARSLGEGVYKEAVAPLIDVLSDDESGDVREWAARSLARVKDDRVVEALAMALDDSDGDVREWAARGLGSYGEDRMRSNRPFGKEEPLMPVVSRDEGRVLEQKVVRKLIDSLNNEDVDVREWVVRSLGYVGGGESIYPLIEKLTDSSAAVREWAARSLGVIGDQRSVQPLIDLLRDQNPAVREWAIRSLGAIQDDRMVLPLIDATGDDSAAVREWAARALGAYGDRQAVYPLMNLLRDPSPDVRHWAKRALENLE